MCLPASAQEDTIRQNFLLDTIEVKAKNYNNGVRSTKDGSIIWNISMLDQMPKILGNSDPMHYAQMLPGIQTNNEYQSGISIQGFETSHNNIAIGGVTIYNVNHLLGFFSTFNASHYPSFSLKKTINASSQTNRLGGELDMTLPDHLPDSLRGEMAIGLISSQGTIHIPISRKTSLTASLRASYINLLYGKWLNIDDTETKYSFYDTNATLTHSINADNKIIADFYLGTDNALFFDSEYLSNIKSKWGNCMGALHWHHTSPHDYSSQRTLYITHYKNQFSLDMLNTYYNMPSSITDYGYKSHHTWRDLDFGLDIALHDIHPQSVISEGSYDAINSTPSRTLTTESSLFADYNVHILPSLTTKLGLRATLYGSPSTSFFASADPLVTINYSPDKWQLSATYALRHQYLFQTGFSNIGLPTDFWISADGTTSPQYAHEMTASLSTYLVEGIRISADIFFHRMYNQIEYNASVLDLANTQYDIKGNLIHGYGNNYGASVMIHKQTGKVTGWISYTYTHARRTFPKSGMYRQYPATRERPHEFNAVTIYSPTHHWDLSATFVCASGTPFTAPESISYINDNIITRFGEYNSHRLGTYIRLDLSSSYKWTFRNKIQHGINLSLYNATSHRNHLFYYIKKRHIDKTFAYRPVSFIVNILPSINYFCKF